MELGWQHFGRQLWRWQGVALEGEVKGWLGVRERDDELKSSRINASLVT